MEISSLQQELTTMDKRLTEMEDKMDSIDSKLTQVVDAILGNPLTKQGGFIAEISDLRAEIKTLKSTIEVLQKRDDEHDTFKNRIIWSLGVIIGIGLLFKFFTTIYANLAQ